MRCYSTHDDDTYYIIVHWQRLVCVVCWILAPPALWIAFFKRWSTHRCCIVISYRSVTNAHQKCRHAVWSVKYRDCFRSFIRALRVRFHCIACYTWFGIMHGIWPATNNRMRMSFSLPPLTYCIIIVKMRRQRVKRRKTNVMDWPQIIPPNVVVLSIKFSPGACNRM